MTGDEPNDSTPPSDLIIAPLKDRPLEELPPEITKALRGYPDLKEHTLAIRKDFLRIQERATEVLGPVLDGIEIGCPDLTETLAEWDGSLARGEVPAEFGDLSLSQAKERYLEGLFFFRVLGLIRSDVESALSTGLPTAGLMPTRRDELHLEKLRAEGREAEAEEYETRLVSRSIQAASNLSDAFASFLLAFRRVLNILAGVRAADLVHSRGVRKQRHKATLSPKHAPGIQAAVNAVYRNGFTEQECWASLEAEGDLRLKVEGREYTVQVDAGEEEEPTVYEFTQNRRTKQERSVKRGSFYPYFKRAQEAASIR